MENILYELARKRRSIRRYGAKHIDDEVIREIIKVALTAPTSFGHKPVEYVIVRDKDMIRKIGACKQMGGSQINGADAVIVVMVKTADKRQAEFWIEDGFRLHTACRGAVWSWSLLGPYPKQDGFAQDL